ncbi:MAG: DsbA family protein [Pseudomonadales bacterium]
MPTVHYFHQVDDPYSHLAIQKLEPLQYCYDIRFAMHLVSPPAGAYQGSVEHYPHWARQDAAAIASGYNTEFRASANLPSTAAIALANQRLAPRLSDPAFAATAIETGNALWAGELASHSGPVTAGERAVTEGNALRSQLGHYQGAMFYFDGEWYWGLDRLRLLEQRLHKEGFARENSAVCVPQPTPTPASGSASAVLLEYFPSLRSPYTAIGHQRVLDLIKATGVTVKVRPVMPMMMRGIPAPRAKQRYIITDAGREGRAHGSPFGRIVDPFGEPVKRAFALFPGATAQGLGMEFISEYLKAAWFDGLDITSTRGLRAVCDNAGLDWPALQADSQKQDWAAILESNLQAMTTHHLWGVPSFRVSGGNSKEAFACWGQDRIWRVSNEIAARA